jgi:hypothetical protein
MISSQQRRIVRIKIQTNDVGIDLDAFVLSFIKDLKIVCDQRDKENNKIEVIIDKIWI